LGIDRRAVPVRHQRENVEPESQISDTREAPEAAGKVVLVILVARETVCCEHPGMTGGVIRENQQNAV